MKNWKGTYDGEQAGEKEFEMEVRSVELNQPNIHWEGDFPLGEIIVINLWYVSYIGSWFV